MKKLDCRLPRLGRRRTSGRLQIGKTILRRISAIQDRSPEGLHAIRQGARGSTHRDLKNWYRGVRSKRSADEQRFWSSLADHGFSLGPLRVAVRSLGSGPNILLLHGVSGSGSQFGHIAPILAERGWRVLMLDIHGEDERGVCYIAIEEISRIILEVAVKNGPLHGLVAHSMGNLWAWYAMARGLRVNRFVSLSGVFSASWAFDRFQQTQNLSDQDMLHLRALLLAHEGEEARLLQDPAAAMARAQNLPQGLIVQSRDDEVVPVGQGRAYASVWPEAAYIEIGGASHTGLLADPAVAKAISAFFGMSPSSKGQASFSKAIGHE